MRASGESSGHFGIFACPAPPIAFPVAFPVDQCISCAKVSICQVPAKEYLPEEKHPASGHDIIHYVSHDAF